MGRPKCFTKQSRAPAFVAMLGVGEAFNSEVWLDGTLASADRTSHFKCMGYGFHQEDVYRPYGRHFYSCVASIEFECMKWRRAREMAECLLEGRRLVSSHVKAKVMRKNLLKFFKSEQAIETFRVWLEIVRMRSRA